MPEGRSFRSSLYPYSIRDSLYHDGYPRAEMLIPRIYYRLGIPTPRARRKPPAASTSQEPPLSQSNTSQDRLGNFTTWDDARSYLEPLRQDTSIIPPSDEELADFMPRLMTRLGNSSGPMAREHTIELAQFMLQNDVLDRLERRSDVRLHLPSLNVEQWIARALTHVPFIVQIHRQQQADGDWYGADTPSNASSTPRIVACRG